MPKWTSFSVAFDTRTNVLTVPCTVMNAFNPATPPPQIIQQGIIAIWDTGATASVITQQVVDALKLSPVGMTPVHGVHGQEIVDNYLVNIALLNGVSYPGVLVTKGKLPPGGPAMLIGMDVIGSGDFAVTNFENKTTLTFRVPSSEKIDFVKQHQAETHREQMQSLIKHRHGKNKKKRR